MDLGDLFCEALYAIAPARTVGLKATGGSATRVGVLTEKRAPELMANGKTFTQADGATVSFTETAAGRFEVVVNGEPGIITTFENISQKSFDRLAKNYGWH